VRSAQWAGLEASWLAIETAALAQCISDLVVAAAALVVSHQFGFIVVDESRLASSCNSGGADAAEASPTHTHTHTQSSCTTHA
jgi:hypothetical protein